MKKVMYIMLTVLFIVSCNHEEATDTPFDDSGSFKMDLGFKKPVKVTSVENYFANTLSLILSEMDTYAETHNSESVVAFYKIRKLNNGFLEVSFEEDGYPTEVDTNKTTYSIEDDGDWKDKQTYKSEKLVAEYQKKYYDEFDCVEFKIQKNKVMGIVVSITIWHRPC